MNTGVYTIKNIINGKNLVGSSINIMRRAEDHFKLLKDNKHYNKDFQSDFNKYGKDSFKLIIIELCNKANLEERELYYINYLNCINAGYNKTELTKRYKYAGNPIPYVVCDIKNNIVHYLDSKNELSSFLGVTKTNNVKNVNSILFDGKYIKYRGTEWINFDKYYLKDLEGFVVKEYMSKYHLAYDNNITISEIDLCTDQQGMRVNNGKNLISKNTIKTPFTENRGKYENVTLYKAVHSIDTQGNITHYISIKEASETMSNKSAYRKIHECVNNKYKKIGNNKYKNLKWYFT